MPIVAVLLVGLARPAGAEPARGLPLPSPLTPLPSLTTPGLPAPSLPGPTLPLPTGPNPLPTGGGVGPVVGQPTSGSGSSGNGSSGGSTGAPAAGAVPAVAAGNALALITANPAADLYPQPPADPVDSAQARLVADLAAIGHRMQYLHNILARTRTDLAYAEQHSGPVAQLIIGMTAPSAPATDAAVAAPAPPGGRVMALSAAVTSGDTELSAQVKAAQALQVRISQWVRPTISRGAVAPASPDYQGGRLLRPVTGPVTSEFGNRFDPYYHVWQLHAGLDIGAATGTPIIAAAGGRVTQAGPFGGYGNYTCIDHGRVDGQRLSTCYGHQSQILVTPGQIVRAGQVIGRVGSTGAATGPHLHFEVRLGGRPTDPAPWI